MELPTIPEIKESIAMGWETLGKFIAKFSYRKEPLPPPDPERPIGPDY